jgi:hypothetical protein
MKTAEASYPEVLPRGSWILFDRAGSKWTSGQ